MSQKAIVKAKPSIALIPQSPPTTPLANKSPTFPSVLMLITENKTIAATNKSRHRLEENKNNNNQL